jgi:hypothetical protein
VLEDGPDGWLALPPVALATAAAAAAAAAVAPPMIAPVLNPVVVVVAAVVDAVVVVVAVVPAPAVPPWSCAKPDAGANAIAMDDATRIRNQRMSRALAVRRKCNHAQRDR